MFRQPSSKFSNYHTLRRFPLLRGVLKVAPANLILEPMANEGEKSI